MCLFRISLLYFVVSVLPCQKIKIQVLNTAVAFFLVGVFSSTTIPSIDELVLQLTDLSVTVKTQIQACDHLLIFNLNGKNITKLNCAIWHEKVRLCVIRAILQIYQRTTLFDEWSIRHSVNTPHWPSRL